MGPKAQKVGVDWGPVGWREPKTMGLKGTGDGIMRLERTIRLKGTGTEGCRLITYHAGYHPSRPKAQETGGDWDHEAGGHRIPCN